MGYIKKDYQAIYDSLVTDLKERLPAMTDFEQGSVIRSLLETLSFEQAVFYEQLDYIYNSSFVNTASSTNLEKVVAILDVKRGEPDYALGTVTFHKEPDYLTPISIPIGTLVTTEDNPDETPIRKAYHTIEEVIISVDETEVNVKVQAETRGREMESEKETVIVIPNPIEGVSRVINQKEITFIGKDRETDDELRERAKKSLLAAGRASEVSIENALLAMPNILDVKIQEQSDQPGVINVYVDGLAPDNSKALGERLNEVRAAGIYARLKPADLTHFDGIIKLTPHPDIIPREIPELEQQVATAIYTYVQGKKMGQPLSVTQLTTEVLNVKGVQDLDQYDITLKDASHSDPDLLPKVEASGVDPKSVAIRYLEGLDQKNSEVYSTPADSKTIKYSDFGRFYVARLRVAAGDKALPIQIQVKIKYPNEASQSSITGKVQGELNKLDFTIKDIQDPELPISEKVFNSFLTAVNAYFQHCKSQINQKISSLRVDPLHERHGAFLTYIKDSSGLYSEDQNTTEVFKMDEKEVQKELYQLIKSDMKEPVKVGIASIIHSVADVCIGEFPASQLTTDLITKASLDLTSQIDALRKEITAINQKLANHQLALVAGKTIKKDKGSGDKSEEDIQKDIEAFQSQVLTKQSLQDDLQNKVNNLSDSLQNLVESWSNAIQEKVLTVGQSAKLTTYTNAISKISDMDVSVRLRTTTFDHTEYYDQPIPVTFIEKPSFDYLWVISKDLRIVGTLKLDLPVTISEEDKKLTQAAVREAINHVLYNQRPEADIELASLTAAAAQEKNVLGAKFDTSTLALVEDQDTARKPIPDRIKAGVIGVGYSEKVLLSDQFFNIT